MSEQNKRTSYQIDLSDKEWQKVENCILKPKTKRGRKHKHPLREIIKGYHHDVRSRESCPPIVLSYTSSPVICETYYICPKRTYSCIKRTRRQQVNSRERIPNADVCYPLDLLYVGARMINYSCKDVVYTNACGD